MASWIFQGNPSIFRIDEYLRDQDSILWQIRQRRFAPQIEVGDEVFLWRAAGEKRAVSGVVALSRVTERPTERPPDPADAQYWLVPPVGPMLQARLRVLDTFLEGRRLVKRDWLLHDPILANLRILKMASGTNYPLSEAESRRLADLCRKTGINWTEEESAIALWAYCKTYGGAVSQKPDSPIAKASVLIGRAVSGIYNKVMNFRAIDPRDHRAGLDAASDVDRLVWDRYFDRATGDLDMPALDRFVAEVEAKITPPIFTAAPKVYRDFGEPPDDDPEELQEFARKVRRGQHKFRHRLLKLYDCRCAISNTGPEAVLDAAHIVSHSTSGINKDSNGILLRCDLHNLFDAGLLTIDETDMRVRLHASLRGTEYWRFEGIKLRPRSSGGYPDAEFLAERNRMLKPNAVSC